MANDLSRWNDWSPYFRMDPDVKFTLTGPRSGLGAIYAWDGKKMGRGRMEITASEPNERITMSLEFLAPMKATNVVHFTLTPSSSGGTLFRWEMSGDRPWLMVVMAFVLRLDRMVSAQFDEGLRLLKGIVDGEKSR